MFCSQCGNKVADGAKFCPNCGAAMEAASAVAPETAVEQETPAYQEEQIYQEEPAQQMPAYPESQTYQDQSYASYDNVAPAAPVKESKNKVTAGILAILLGALGIHKFYLGYTTTGVIMLLVTLLTCGFGGSVMGVIGLVEGILYLTKSDEEFEETYVVNEKTWF